MNKLLEITVYVAFGLWISDADAAGLGAKFGSYRDLHRETDYGSLFFNEGSIRYEQSRQRKRFLEITGDGELELPPQRGYCFVLNHYNSPNGDSLNHSYSAIIEKVFADGRRTHQVVERSYRPTTIVVSSDLPDLCISGVRSVSNVSIRFSSSDGEYFDWRISFRVK
jgi:hypothetical protein